MKKILVLIILGYSFIFSVSIAGELTFSPTKSNPGETITLSYTADGRYFMDELLYARIYSFNSESTQATAYEFMLSYDRGNNRYTGSFTVPVDVVFILAKVSNSKLDDDNRSMYWDMMFYDRGKPVRDAHLKQGLSYLGNLPENMSRHINFKKALENFERELELYPNNIPALVGLTSLELDLQKIDYKEYTSRVEAILKKDYRRNNENEVRAISRALRSLNRVDEAVKLEQEFAGSYPKSQLAEELYVSELSKADNLEKFAEGVSAYLARFTVTDNRERIYSALVSGYLQTGEVDELIKKLNNMEDAPAGAYAQIAFALINDEDLKDITTEYRIEKAKNLMNLALFKIKQNNMKLKPGYMTLKEWEMRNHIRYAGLLEQYGQILMATENYEAALNKFSEAMDMYNEEAPASLYENVISICRLTYKDEIAYETALLAIGNSVENEFILEELGELHKELGKPGNLEIQIVKARTEAEATRLKKEGANRMGYSFSNTIIKNVNDEKTSLGELKGNVAVLMFWSSWCGPCDEALAGLNDLSDEFKGVSSVYIGAVNLWEDEEDKKEAVKKYFEDSGVSFELLIDDKNQLPFELGISGLPTVCFIGKNGELEFIDRGFTNQDDFLVRSKDRIKILLNDD